VHICGTCVLVGDLARLCKSSVPWKIKWVLKADHRSKDDLSQRLNECNERIPCSPFLWRGVCQIFLPVLKCLSNYHPSGHPVDGQYCSSQFTYVIILFAQAWLSRLGRRPRLERLISQVRFSGVIVSSASSHSRRREGNIRWITRGLRIPFLWIRHQSGGSLSMSYSREAGVCLDMMSFIFLLNLGQA